MKTILLIFQLIFGASLIAVILIQSKGSGFSRSASSSVSFTRRGLEKIIYKATFVIVVLFVLVSIAQLIV